jgi:hypothetical protein
VIASAQNQSIIGDACQGYDTAFSVLYGACQSDNLYLRDEPSVLAFSNDRVTLAGTRYAERSVRGVDSFMDEFQFDYDSLPDEQKAVFKNRPGYIYLLKSDHGCKIGRTNKLSARLNTFGLILPFEVTLIHALPVIDAVLAEWFFHGLFSENHIRGEWYDLNDEDIAYFCATGEMESYQYLYGIIPTPNTTPYQLSKERYD